MTVQPDELTDACFTLEIPKDRRQAPLSEYVERALKDYFSHLNGEATTNLYEMLLAEVEAPLFKAVLKHTNGNQSQAAGILGLNRGTLRKKLKTYGCL